MSSRLAVPCLGALFALFLLWLYYPCVDAFFANDDWVLIWHIKRIPITEPWRYFSLHTIWFYRPLQTLQYGLTLHFAGMNHFWFSIQSLIMHLGVCLLFWKLIRELFGIGLATLSTLLFCVSCLSPDTILWSPNFNTLHHALLTLAASYYFLKYLRSGSHKYYLIALCFAVLNCFSKESCVNLGPVLFSIWLTNHLQTMWGEPRVKTPLKSILSGIDWRKAFSIFVPFFLITLIFTVVHRLFFKNTEPFYRLAYGFTTPRQALSNLMFNTNFSLSGLIAYPLTFKASPVSGLQVVAALRYAAVIPFILLIFGLLRRNPVVVFCVLFAVSLQIPTFALLSSDENRYFYLSGGSCALLLAAVTLWAIDGMRRYTHKIAFRMGAYVSLAGFVTVFIVNIICFQYLQGNAVLQSRFVERAYEFIGREGNSLPTPALVLLDIQPNNFFRNGMGVSEMLSLATDKAGLYGSTMDVALEKNGFDQLSNMPKFKLNVFSMDLKFEPISQISKSPAESLH